MVCMSDAVFNRRYEFFEKFYDMPKFGEAYIYGVLYCASSGTSHSGQYALAEMLGAAADGKLNFVDHCREYGRRGGIVKKILADTGFNLVYSKDGDQEIADGFFMTAGYDNMPSADLQQELLRYGVSTISLPSTGSEQNGVRITVSLISDDKSFKALEERLKLFQKDHPKK